MRHEPQPLGVCRGHPPCGREGERTCTVGRASGDDAPRQYRISGQRVRRRTPSARPASSAASWCRVCWSIHSPRRLRDPRSPGHGTAHTPTSTPGLRAHRARSPDLIADLGNVGLAPSEADPLFHSAVADVDLRMRALWPARADVRTVLPMKEQHLDDAGPEGLPAHVRTIIARQAEEHAAKRGRAGSLSQGRQGRSEIGLF
jgi:hypothetical protein